MQRAHTSAGLVVYKLEPRRAVTLVANHHVFTDVRAATVVQETLVKIWNTGNSSVVVRPIRSKRLR